jgi:hypothetical protein
MLLKGGNWLLAVKTYRSETGRKRRDVAEKWEIPMRGVNTFSPRHVPDDKTFAL